MPRTVRTKSNSHSISKIYFDTANERIVAKTEPIIPAKTPKIPYSEKRMAVKVKRFVPKVFKIAFS